MPAPATPIRINLANVDGLWTLYDDAGNSVIVNTATKKVRIGNSDSSVGFYGTAPIALQTGVAVSAAGIHAACVALGLFTA